MEKQFDIANHLNASIAGFANAPMGLGVGQGNARREHERGKLREVGGGKISHGQTSSLGLVARHFLIVPNNHMRAAALKRARGRKAAKPQADDRNFAAGENRHGNHDDKELSAISGLRGRQEQAPPQ